MNKSHIIVSVGGPAILGVNSANLERSIPTGDPILITLASVGIIVSLLCIYNAYKIWYYRGGTDSLEELEKDLRASLQAQEEHNG